jgi:hypothetical protein
VARIMDAHRGIAASGAVGPDVTEER